MVTLVLPLTQDTSNLWFVNMNTAVLSVIIRVTAAPGDGDYIKMVKYLIKKNRLAKILAPNHKSFSSLYKNMIDNSFYDFLDINAVKQKIAMR